MATNASDWSMRPTKLPLPRAESGVATAAGIAVGIAVVAVGTSAVGISVGGTGVAVGAVSVAICDNSAARVWVGAMLTVAAGVVAGTSVAVAAGPPQAASAR